MENYPNQPPLQPPPGYNPLNPYAGYDPGYDYVPWLPGRQGPRFLPVFIVVVLVLFCSCCAFFTGVIFGIELPGFIQPSESAPPEEPVEPTPQEFHWQLLPFDHM